MIAALFVDPAGPYVGLAHVDPWDEKRDARAYAGSNPVVAHPPCERWGRFADGSPTHKGRFKVGDDGGCFAAAVAAVRTWGGVIEHPQGSHAWPAFGLPIPRAGRRRSSGWTVPDAWGGRSCHVDQGAYGHKAQKPTWLYAVLPAYPDMDWRRTWGMEYRIGGAGYHSKRERARAKARAGGEPRSWKYLPEGERHLTPPTFRDALLSLAQSCAGWKPNRLHTQASITLENVAYVCCDGNGCGGHHADCLDRQVGPWPSGAEESAGCPGCLSESCLTCKVRTNWPDPSDDEGVRG